LGEHFSVEKLALQRPVPGAARYVRLWGEGQSELGNSAWGSSSVVQVSDDGTLDLGDEMETVSQMGGLRDILER
jgi:hypothetical protein